MRDAVSQMSAMAAVGSELLFVAGAFRADDPEVQVPLFRYNASAGAWAPFSIPDPSAGFLPSVRAGGWVRETSEREGGGCEVLTGNGVDS